MAEGDAMYMKAFEEQAVQDTETLPLTYLPDRWFSPSTQPNQSPIEANKSNEMLIDLAYF